MTVPRLFATLLAASALSVVAPLGAPAVQARETPTTGLSARALQYNDIADADTSLSSNKHAVILLDEMSVHVRPDGSQTIRVHKVVRIQTPYGRVKYRMVYFQYNALVDQVKMEFAGARMADGKFVTYGAAGLKDTLVQAVQREGCHVLWICDPMHGNTESTSNGFKTRRFDNIQSELDRSFDIHAALGSRLGGVHLELTGENVTECLGGARELTEIDLERAYRSTVDPRLNYEQSLEIAMLIVRKRNAL